MQQPQERARIASELSETYVPLPVLFQLVDTSQPVMTLYYTLPARGLDSEP